MREFNLDLLNDENVAVNCKTKEELNEILNYLRNVDIKFGNMYENFDFDIYEDKTCFSLNRNKEIIFWDYFLYKSIKWKILSLDDLAIKPKNNFKEYGFEADFEGAILSDIEDYYIGYYVESYPCIKEKQKIPTFWNKNNGNCYKGAGVLNSKFSLKPIKKEWYENPDNFPCLVYHIYGNSYHIATDITIEKGIMLIINNKNRPCDVFRPATKEEVLSLLIKE